MDLKGKNGIIVGPNDTSLYFYNGHQLKIKQKKQGTHTPPTYAEQNLTLNDDKSKSFIFSTYHENTFFEGSEDIHSICIECEDNDTYGWNVKFDNGLFMSIADVIEYQNKNKMLPDTDGILYHGANRLEFSKIKNIIVYKKPFYYGYGMESE